MQQRNLTREALTPNIFLHYFPFTLSMFRTTTRIAPESPPFQSQCRQLGLWRLAMFALRAATSLRKAEFHLCWPQMKNRTVHKIDWHSRQNTNNTLLGQDSSQCARLGPTGSPWLGQHKSTCRSKDGHKRRSRVSPGVKVPWPYVTVVTITPEHKGML